MLSGRRLRGELRLDVKSGLNKKNRRFGLFQTTLKFFYTSRGGGSEAPIRRMARWGLLLNLHESSLEKSNFNPRVCFLRLLLRDLYGPSHIKQF